MVTEIPWGDGSGDLIYLSYSASEGDQTVLVSSDANAGVARSKVVTFASGVGSITRQLTVSQEAGVRQYVQDGLVFWLDGIDKGPDNTAWVDLVNGVSFTNYGATFNADHISFNGTNSYLENLDYIVPAAQDSTIEVCLETDATGTTFIFLPITDRGVALGYYLQSGQLRVIWSYYHNQPMYGPAISKGTISVNRLRGFANGTAMTTYGRNFWSRVNGNNVIGVNKSKNNFFSGKIYSIRIYNRQLTEAEILANQALDNERFNLGLTL